MRPTHCDPTLYSSQNFPPMRLYTRSQGQGYPILCLHGHPGSSQSMAVFTDHLSNSPYGRYRTLAPDLRGYGSSRVHEPFMMTDHLEDLAELLD
ncbi:MAG TPA: alpha/beta hydrolase, partial [Trichocoleus sp.]